MLCPVMSYHRKNFEKRECEEEKCEWWNKNWDKCDIKTLDENSE